MVGICEQREPHVGEHKVLCQEVEEVKEVLCPLAGLHREVEEGVVGLHYPAK